MTPQSLTAEEAIDKLRRLGEALAKNSEFVIALYGGVPAQVADLITRQAEEIERLRDVLAEALNDPD